MKDYPLVEILDQEHFVDLAFKIFSVEKLSNGNCKLIVKGTVNQQKVGFAIEFQSSWEIREQGFGLTAGLGKAVFISTGSDTQRWINELANLYSIPAAGMAPFDQVQLDVVSLSGNPNHLLTEPCRMKIFLNSESDDDDLYAEMLINLDVANNRLEWCEKSPDYRQALIKSFAHSTIH